MTRHLGTIPSPAINAAQSFSFNTLSLIEQMETTNSNMALSSFYRHKAAQCHRLADAALRSDVRQSYEELEQNWNAIAEREEREERRFPIALD
jgi:hypothetical protein